MAVTIADNITTQNNLDAAATFTSIGGGPGASLLDAMVYQGTQAGARRIGSANSDHGFTIGEATSRNINTSGFEVFWFKGFVKQRGALTNQRLRLGSSSTAYYTWTTGDNGTIPLPQFEYPIPGGFVVQPVFVGLRAWHDVPRSGSPDVTAINTYGITHNVTATANGEDSAMDSLQWSHDGLYLTGGTPDGTFQDFLDADEGQGSSTAGRIGMWQSRNGIFFVYAKHVIGRTNSGTVTATQFTDAFTTIVFPGGKTNTNYNGFEFDLGNVSTSVNLTNCSFVGQGRSNFKVYFDTELDVTGGATDSINIPGHGFVTGEQVAYSAEGGSQDIGPDATTGEGSLVTTTTLPTGDRWYVIATDANTIQLASTLANALASTATGLTPSGAGNGENHSLTRHPDTRPDLDFTGTSGSATLTGCQFNRFNRFNLTSGVTLDGCVLISSKSMSLSNATLDGCTIAESSVAVGESFITAIAASELTNVSGCSFDAGSTGHAINVTTTAGSISFSNNQFSGYGGDPDPGNGWQFDTESDITGGATDTISYSNHGMTTGDPIYYENEGGTETIGLTNGSLYYVRADDASTLGIFRTREAAETNTNRMSLTPSTAGNGEVHTLYSGNAAFHNSTGGLITLNIVDGGNSPSVRNSNGSSTIIQNAVSLTINTNDEDGNPVENVRVRIERQSDGSLVTDGLTNASGVFSDSFNFTSSLAVNIIVRLVGFIPFETTGTITSAGLSVNVRLIEDTIVDRRGS